MEQITLSKFLGKLASSLPFTFRHLRRFYNGSGKDTEEFVFCHAEGGYVYVIDKNDFDVNGAFEKVPPLSNIYEYLSKHLTIRDDFFELSFEEVERIIVLEGLS